MQNKLVLVAATALLSITAVSADLCSMGSTEIDGNWYCQPVDAIQYSNVGTSGSYDQVTNMLPDGRCASAPKPFNGPISPLDEEVSLHFRGPLQLKQLAVYTLSTSSNVKREASAADHRRRGHQHGHLHKRAKGKDLLVNEQKRQEVTATIDGQVVSWVKNWVGEAPVTQTGSSAVSTSSPQMVTATIDGQVVSWVNNWFGGEAGPTATQSASQSDNTAQATLTAYVTSGSTEDANEVTANTSDTTNDISSPGAYERIGYYDSAAQTLDNLVFLGNYGGQGSGCFDYAFGASLSYVNCDGTGGAASPQILADTTIPSDAEVIVMLAQECGETDCGFVRPGTIAYHGFDGVDKVVLIEFSMPMDSDSGFNGDMPAIWMLNAQIPRTLQYGNAACSCWESGCGEFDIAEALNSGSTYLKSTLHTNTPGGSSDYILRPTSGTMKLAVVFSSNSTIQVQVLSNSTDFGSSLTLSDIQGMCGAGPQNRISYFTIS